MTRDTDLGDPHPLPVTRNQWTEYQGVCTAYATVSALRLYLPLLWSARKWRPDVLYFNSFFDFRLSILPQLLYLVGWWGSSAKVVAVRGEFGSAAVAIKTRKKRAFIRLYKMLRLHTAVVWHASSQREAQDIRMVMGAQARVLVRRNDSLLPAPISSTIPTRGVGEALRAVFVGRIVPIKGLDVLMEALGKVSGDVQVDVYGPDEDPGFASRCRELARGAPKTVAIRFLGPLEPQLVRPAIANADLFLMPTKGENFGQVIAEALSCSVPVMLMDVTPWTSTIRDGGGVLVSDGTPEAWAREISAYARGSSQEWTERRRLAAGAYERWFEDRPSGDLFEQWDAEMTTSPSHGIAGQRMGLLRRD